MSLGLIVFAFPPGTSANTEIVNFEAIEGSSITLPMDFQWQASSLYCVFILSSYCAIVIAGRH